MADGNLSSFEGAGNYPVVKSGTIRAADGTRKPVCVVDFGDPVLAWRHYPLVDGQTPESAKAVVDSVTRLRLGAAGLEVVAPGTPGAFCVRYVEGQTPEAAMRWLDDRGFVPS